MNAPHIKQNPHPRMRYEITLTIKDAPGPFDAVTGFMQYDVTNEQCSPYNEFIGIYRKPQGQSPPIVFVPVGNGEYRGTIYLDLLQDEDYYGLGVCHWSMTAAIVELKVGEATFSPDMMQSQVVSEQTIARYFAKRSYGDNSIKDMNYIGTTAEDVAQRRDEFFAVSLSAKEKFE
jgi:hypothetical protein